MTAYFGFQIGMMFDVAEERYMHYWLVMRPEGENHRYRYFIWMASSASIILVEFPVAALRLQIARIKKRVFWYGRYFLCIV